MTAQDTIVQLNKYPPDKYNVLIPVTSMQVMSNLQKVIVNEVQLNPDPNRGNDVYYEKQSGKLAITAVGGTKLAAAASSTMRTNSQKYADGAWRWRKPQGKRSPAGTATTPTM